MAEKLKNPEFRWPLLAEAAELALEAGQNSQARRQLVEAVEILRDLSLHFPEGEERDRFLARPDRSAVLNRLKSLGTG